MNALEWIKEELATEVEELREIAEAEAAERRKARRRFRWGSLVTAIVTVAALLLLRPGVADEGLQRRRGGSGCDGRGNHPL